MPKVYNDYTQATSAESTDVLYMVRSPYGSGDDRWATLADIGIDPALTYREETLDANTIATATTIDTVNVTTIRAGDWVAVEAYDNDCEIRRVDSVSGNTLTLDTALNNAHTAGDTVIKLDGPVWIADLFGVSPDNTGPQNKTAIDAAVTDFDVYSIKRKLTFAETGKVYTIAPLAVNPVQPINLSGQDDWLLDLNGAELRLDSTFDFTSNDVDAHMIIVIDCERFIIENGTINGQGVALIAFGEQKHGIYIGSVAVYTIPAGQSRLGLIRNIHFEEIRGDGIFLIGDNVNTVYTENITMENITSNNCRRTGLVAHQRYVRYIYGTQMQSEKHKNSAIDLEPTGAATLYDVHYDNIVIDQSQAETVSIVAISISGNGAEHIKLTDVTIIQGQIEGLLSDHITIDGLILTGPSDTSPCMSFRNYTNFKMMNSHITATGGGRIGNFTVSAAVGVDESVISQNYFIQQGNQQGLTFEDCNNMTVSENIFVWDGPGANDNTRYGLQFRALTTNSMQNAKAHGNTFQGAWLYGIESNRMDGCDCSHNTFDGTSRGIFYDNAHAVYPIAIGNDFNKITSSVEFGGIPNAGAIIIAGNARHLFQALCTGTPEAAVTADIGCTAVRTDGGASTTFYVKESGTGNTGWVAK